MSSIKKIICSWCNKEIDRRVGHGDNDLDISHGICNECSQFFAENWPGTLHDFINKIQIPVLVVDEEGKINTANKLACSTLNKDISKIENQLGGDVMQCAYARLPGGCGQTIHCNGCTIRTTVMKTFERGIGTNKVKAYQDIETEQGTQRMMILISTKKIKDIVLLKIDKMEPQPDN